MCKKRQISNFASSERVKIWHQRSFPYARVRIVCDKSYLGLYGSFETEISLKILHSTAKDE